MLNEKASVAKLNKQKFIAYFGYIYALNKWGCSSVG